MSVLDAVIASARDAGRAIQEVAASAIVVSEKGVNDPVTEADRRADALLRSRLTALVDAAWLSEETADDGARLTRDRAWIVDPLDGTKEFIERVPNYSVAVALVERGEPVLAVVHNPSTGEVYWAERARGAFRDGARMRVAEGRRILSSRSEMRAGEFDAFARWELEPVGSIALKLAMVAAGDGAATLSRGPKWEWDVCAGSLLVTEAGGVVTDATNEPLRFNNAFPKVRGVLAGAAGTVAQLRETLAFIGMSSRMDEMGRAR